MLLTKRRTDKREVEAFSRGSRSLTPNRDAERLPSLSQADVTRIYNRNARLYDLVQAPMDLLLVHRWRSRLLEDVQGRALEIGVGTGLNLPFYPPRDQAQVIAIDISEEMLKRARRRRERVNLEVELQQADVQQLPFQDESFNTVFAAFVFCSVADPVQGLKEACRVLKPGGQLRLLEHQRPPSSILAKVFDVLNPLTVRLSGVNINRRTDANVRAAGFKNVRSERLERFGIFRLITAFKPEGKEAS